MFTCRKTVVACNLPKSEAGVNYISEAENSTLRLKLHFISIARDVRIPLNTEAFLFLNTSEKK